MSQNTRSRRALGSLDVKTAGKTNAKSTAAETKVTKEKKAGKVRSVLKTNLEQKENAVPSKQVEKTSVKKKSKPKASVLSSKLHPVKESDKSSGDTVLALKSPALRDRTNTASEMADEKEVSTKKKIEAKSKVAKKTANKKGSKKSEQKIEKVAPLEKSSDDSVPKVPAASNEKYSTKEIEDMINNDEEFEINPKRVNKGKNAMKNVKVSIKKVNVETEESRKTNSNRKTSLRKKNMSMEEVEDLLNDDEEVDEVEPTVKNNKFNGKRKAKDAELSDEEDSDPKIQKVDEDAQDLETASPNNVKSEQNPKNKKFFKHKRSEEETESATASKKPRRRVMRKRNKAVDDDESDIDVIMEAEKEPVEPVKKNLRLKVNKNYCELSRMSQSFNSKSVKKSDDEKKDDEETGKDEKNHLPIYKTVKLSQEKVKDKEEIYEFPDDSQDKGQQGKNRKKTVKKPAAKRSRKAAVPRTAALQKKQKKPVTQIPKTVKFEVEAKKLQHKEKTTEINAQSKNKVDSVEFNHEVPKDFPNIEDTVVENTPAIKIISNKKLNSSHRINLMATPTVPKTITSELKIFGPKNAITSEPTTMYNNMANHSLIRQSMSPINKIDNEFDVGSPWRPIDTFSRIKKVVQSTPQIVKRPLVKREKKMPVVPMHLSEKSINSADTIHLSANNGSANNGKLEVRKNQTSPRKFGTEISNTSPIQSKSSEDIHEAKTIIQSKKSPTQAVSMQTTIDNNDLQSPAKATSPPGAFSKSTNNVQPEMSAAVAVSETSIQQSPTKQKNKFTSPSPFRLEKTRNSEKKEPTKLKQTNLHAFLKLNDMPESTTISTVHGIFDDVPSSPSISKRPKKFNLVEPNIENAFGFDDDDTMDETPTKSLPVPKFATKEDVRKSIKGKLFPNVRVKSTLPNKVSTSTTKKALLKSVLDKKQKQEKLEKAKLVEDSDDSSNFDEIEKINNHMESGQDSESQKKAILDAVSFSDTFDVLSENGDLESKVPDEVPLFVDLEPVHFSQPPRKSYNKRKRGVCFETSKEYENESEDEVECKRPKQKRKKDPLSKEERKRMQQWVKSINETFEEIDHFDLVVE